MILLLTMAGHYERFAQEGYTLPKYLLPWGDRSILWTILSELGDYSDVYLVGNQRDEPFMPHVRQILGSFGFPPKSLVTIPSTSGQAETAFLGLNKINASSTTPVMIHNVDTILFGRHASDAHKALVKYAGYIDVFSASNREYSYVLVDSEETRCVTEIAEKVVVSNLATSGLYGFASVGLYRRFYEHTAPIYISTLYKEMLLAGQKIVTGPVYTEEETVVLGTPSEYISMARRWL